MMNNTLQFLTDTSHQTSKIAESLLFNLEVSLSSHTPFAKNNFNDNSTSENIYFSRDAVSMGTSVPS